MRSAILLLMLGVGGCVAVPLAAAQDRGRAQPPTELWRAYPLDEARPATPPVRPRPGAARDDGGGLIPAQLLALIAFGAVIAVAAALRYASRPRSVTDLARTPVLPPPVPTRPGRARPRALGYTAVFGDGDAAWELLRDETRAIEAACNKRGMALGRLVREIDPDMNMPRPGLEYALERLAGGEFACLVVTRLDRLAGSASELAALVREFERHQVRLVVTEIDFDSAARASRVAAGALARADRIVDGHGARPVRPAPMSGTLADHPELRQRIVDMRASGMTLQAIANTLNAEGVPTLRGGTEWRPSSLYGAIGQRRPPRSRR